MSRRVLLEGYQPKDHPRVSRSGLSYDQTKKFCLQEIQRYVTQYHSLASHDQTARLIRDMIDVLLRRYHGYCIEEQQGAHYRERGLTKDIKTEFEHVIPAKVARDAVLAGKMSIEDALNIPTCQLSRTNHRELKRRGLAKLTPDPYWFWQRYQELGVDIETRDGTPVDLDTWHLDRHHEYFS
jgi:hypothetical protein